MKFKEKYMPSIDEQIAEIIKQRKACLPMIDDALKRCGALRGPVEETRNIIEELEENSTGNEMLADACAHCKEALQSFRTKISDIEQRAFIAQKRFARDTINIGFGGPKGMGKSFLLQKLSGLTDNEVPSADGLPVTAVRSIIKNSPKNKADVTFHDVQSFLEQRIWPLCRAIHIPEPRSILEFQTMSLPENRESDLEIQYCQKLEKYQKALPEYEHLLSGESRAISLAELRPYVAYSLPSPDGDRPVPSNVYLAVASVKIYCLFPRTTVRELLLIDLPGLGELDPSLESIHTEGFKDNVDLCLFVRRPACARPDWDREAQAALDTLTQSCPAGRPSDFVLMVINGGGCRKDYADIMEEETRTKLESRYTILSTSSSDSEGLSRDILAKALDHLAVCLPNADNQLLTDISASLSELSQKIMKFCDEAKRTLRQHGQGQDAEEIVRRAAEQARQSFSNLNWSILEKIENMAVREDDLEEVISTLDHIQGEMDEYFAHGMDEGSMEQWHKKAMESYAETGGISTWQADTINKLRVQIAQRFSQELDSVYRDYICVIQQEAVAAFNNAEVMNGLLSEGSPEKDLQKLVEYFDNAELTVPQMREAVEGLLHLKIEHNAQFYPRAYDPVRSLKKIADNMLIDGKTRDEKCRNLYMNLVDMGSRTILDIKNRIIEETRNNLFNILLVAYEKFDDLIIRNVNVLEEWIRFFKSYFSDIRPLEQKTNKSYLLNKTIRQLEALRARAI